MASVRGLLDDDVVVEEANAPFQDGKAVAPITGSEFKGAIANRGNKKAITFCCNLV
jgi:hypothetical protein